jgi:hypothetical protein
MKTFFEKIQSNLFADRAKTQSMFTPSEQDIIIRYRAVFSKWLANPQLPEIEIINYMVNEFGIKRSQSYYDIGVIKSLIGNVQNAGKEFQRYRATEMILQGYELAERAKNATEVKRALTYIKAAETLTKVHKLNSIDVKPVQWEDIIPLELEPTTDVSVIGRKPIENLEELKAKLRKKYHSID